MSRLRRHTMLPLAAACCAGLLAVAGPARAQSVNQPEILKQITFDQKLGAQLPLDLPFKDEAGRDVTLGTYFGKRPVLLVLAYYNCPMLCTLVLNGVVTALNVVDLRMSQDYDVVTVSIDPQETPELAAAKKASYQRSFLKHEDAVAGWHFLTGPQSSIERLAATVGFGYAYDPEQGQYAHASGIMVATPDGRLSKYFYGTEYTPRDLRLGFVDAGGGRIGTLVDQVLLRCYHYDPLTGRYGLAIVKSLRIAALLTVAALGTFMIRSLWRERHTPRPGVAL